MRLNKRFIGTLPLLLGAGIVGAAEPAAHVERSRMIISGDQNGRTYRIVDEDGEVSAVLDGQPLDAASIKRDGRTYRLIGADGQALVVTTHPAGASLSIQPTMRVVGTLNAPRPPAPPATVAPPEPPPVMLGITMSEPDGILRAHLRLPEKGGVVVDRVIEGLPAERAGLRQHDVIVAMDDEDGVTIESLRAALRDREPGDTLRLRVISRGERRDVELRLEAYEAEKLRIQEAPAEVEIDLRVPGADMWSLFGGMAPRMRPDLEQLKAQLQETLRGVEDAIPEEEIKRKLRDAIARLETETVQALGRVDAAMPDPEWIRRQVQERMYRAAPERDDVRRRFEELESRLQRLEERLTRQLDRLHERLGTDENPR